MRKLLQKTLMLTIIAALGVSVAIEVSAVSAAKQSNPTPLSISFATPLPQTSYSQIGYQAKIDWTNPNADVPYTGSLLLTATSKSGKINAADITLIYKGLAISPQQSTNTLLYYLPQQSFDAKKSGTFMITVTYDTMGSYNWEIVVVK